MPSKATIIAILFTLLAATTTLLLTYHKQSYVTLRPTTGKAVKAVYASGVVEPVVMVPIAAKASTRITDIMVNEGDNISKGQILVKLEASDIEFNIQSLAAKENYAKVEYERELKLFDKKFASKESVEQMKASYEAAAADRKAAASQAKFYDLVAPSNGTVLRRDGDIGALIASNTPILWVSSTAELQISADVDEEDIAHVKARQKVLVQSDAFPHEVFNAVVKSITPKGDPNTRTFRVRISLPQDTPFMVGMNVECNILIYEREGAILIPTETVDHNSVWILNNGKIKKQAVKIGVIGLDKTEIIEGLDESDLVITNWRSINNETK